LPPLPWYDFPQYGGGINNGGPLTVSDSTIFGNQANFGGGIYNNGNATLRIGNTIIAANADNDVDGLVTSTGYNLIGSVTGSTGFGAIGDQVVDSPFLGTLGNYGGPTQTFSLQSGITPAIIGTGGATTTLTQPIDANSQTISVVDAGAIASTPGQYVILIDTEEMLVTGVDLVANALTVLQRGYNGTSRASHSIGAAVNPATDQRGSARTVNGKVDIGAVEYENQQMQVSPVVVTPRYASATVPLGLAFPIDLGSFSDTSSNAGPWTVAVSWGDATTAAFVTSAQGPIGTLAHLYAAPGTYAVTLTVSDANGNASQAISFLTATSANSFAASASNTPASVIQAVNALTNITEPNIIILDLGGGTYSTNGIAYGPPDSNTAQYVTFIVQNGTLTNSGNAPTVLVSDGALSLRNDTIEQETTVSSEPAISITGGTVDLGTAASPGNNLVNINIGDTFVQNTTANPVAPVGDSFKVNGGPLPPIPVNLTVTNRNDSGAGSLRRAVNDAMVFGLLGGGAPSISFDSSLAGQTIPLTKELLITFDMAIDGPGAGQLAIDGGNSGSNVGSRIFEVASGVAVTLSGLTIQNGFASGVGGAILNGGMMSVNNSIITGSSAAFGGAIADSGYGQLTLRDSIIKGNSAASGGGICAYYLQGSGNVTINGSTISDNLSINEGGGIACFGNSSDQLVIRNSTISGNSAGTGGGIFNTDYQYYYNRPVKTGELTNVTIADNHCSSSGGGIFNFGFAYGGNRTWAVPFAINNSIVADNTNVSTGSADDIGGASVVGAYNLIGTGGSGGLQDQSVDPAHHNRVGVANPGLGGLIDNHGPTFTMAPTTGSPAIGNGSAALAVDPNGNPLLTDQRGFGYLRTVTDPTTGTPTVDIGAYQTQPSLTPRDYLETVASGTLPVNPTTGNPTAGLSLDTQAQADAFMSVFSSSNPNPLTVPSGAATLIDIAVSVAGGIQVNEAALSIPIGFRVAINGGIWHGGSPALTLNAGNLTVTNAIFQNATDAPTILVAGGSLTLRSDAIQESTGYTDAAISITGGTLDLGTTVNYGRNTLNVNGTGEFVHNTTGSLVPAAGDTFEINGVAQAAPFLSFTTLSSSAAKSAYGQKVTLTATVTPDTTGAATPTGSVDFYDVTSSTDLGGATLSGGSASLATSSLAVGSHLIRLTYAGDNNYLPSLDSLTQTITPATLILTVTANNATMVYGSALPAFSYTITGFMNGDSASVVSGAASLTTTATSSSGVGSYPIVVAQGTLSAANYTFNFVNGTLTITPAPLSVTANNQTKVYGAAVPTLTGTLTGIVNGDNITASFSTTATASSDVVAGGYPITATLNDPNGRLNNYIGTNTPGTLTITPANQTITWASPAPMVDGVPLSSAQLNATVPWSARQRRGP
jgi:hypothetical protein